MKLELIDRLTSIHKLYTLMESLTESKIVKKSQRVWKIIYKIGLTNKNIDEWTFIDEFRSFQKQILEMTNGLSNRFKKFYQRAR